MVKFKLVEENEGRLVFWYYPEGNYDKRPGVIVADLNKDEIDVTELAEEDWERDIPPEEINVLANAINEMKRERGETDFVELATKPVHNIYYGDHAVSEIVKHLREGIVPKKGMQAWY